MKEQKKLQDITRKTRDYIFEAIKDTGSTNRNVLCENIAAKLEDRFKFKTLDYQLKRMNLETTGDILNAIDTYMYKYARNDLKKMKKEQEMQEMQEVQAQE